LGARRVDKGADRLIGRGGDGMWVLVIIALNGPMIFTIPGYSSEQTCSAHANEAIAKLPRLKSGIRWTYRCIKPD
jgi:uncharacterized protein YegP (UPF0339 family)